MLLCWVHKYLQTFYLLLDSPLSLCNVLLCLVKSIFSFFKNIYEREREQERERERVHKLRGEEKGEADFPLIREPQVGLDPRTSGP